MSGLYFTDLLQVNIPKETRERLKKFTHEVKVNDSLAPSTLLVRIDATHSGYINGNKILYMTDKMRASAYTWTHRYERPVLLHHDKQGKTIGRVMNAEYLETDSSFEADNPNAPKGYIQLLVRITDEKAIDMLQDGRLKTVSIGGSTKEAWCSICNQDLANDGICAHQRGKWYVPGGEDPESTDEQKVQCHWRLGLMDYKECSFVNVPADEYAQVVNMEYPSSLGVGDAEEVANVDFAVVTSGRQLTLQDFLETELSSDVHVKESNMKTNSNAATPEDSNAQGSEEEEHVENVENATETDEEVTTQEDESGKSPATEDESSDKTSKEETSEDSDYTEKEILQLVELDKQLEDEVHEKDARLSAAQRKNMSSSTFCGPNRSFPVNDCAHYTAALRLLNRAKVSDSTKAKIRACVLRKGKSLGCSSAKKSNDAIDEALRDQLSLYVAMLEDAENLAEARLVEITDLKQENQRLTEENAQLREGSHSDRAEEVLRLKLALKKPDVKHILEADETASDDLKKKFLAKLVKRSEQSLRDSLGDLRLEYQEYQDHKETKSPTLERVENPSLSSADDNGDRSPVTTLSQFKGHRRTGVEWLLGKDVTPPSQR